ncbi:multi-sensor signal transduction histidine kinase [Geobacter metallireducens RCH3]|uniref:histidine kinase n=1 Tax=Geobacter metallireducens (strain ATCC 53774 / DSM 7210 / GS-15) TaxID=269799 RepID=Q39XK5_GEOMG|nr:ATP-binding protein [Geobacter metallireducens]ABB31019.1 sensor histidine kinase, HAMP and PAS domain-containing [Geobacter metallireducens GS-15]EHP86025.1 multi-sensor signal transduction histidine kinase [Geobacter metallireducens RCH3]
MVENHHQQPPIISPPEQERKKRRREAIIIAISVLLILVLTRAEIHLSRISSEVPMGSNILIFGIINIIILLIILLIYLVFRNVAKLLMERRSKAIGANLQTKLVIAFMGLSLVPTMLLFVVSASYVNMSIRNWFNTQVESSLSESLEVAQTYYKNSAANALYYGRQISSIIRDERLLNEENLPRLRELVRRKQQEYNLGIVEVYSSQNEELVRSSNPGVPQGEFTNPSSEDIKMGLNGKELSRVNTVGKADLIRGIMPIYSTYRADEVVGVVVVNYVVPYSLVEKMREITSSYEEFRQLKILKNPIRSGYILTLFLVTMVIVFLAVWFGIYLANSLTTPIKELAEATRQVAEGNLDVQLGQRSSDEFGMLVAAFNKMTLDLRSHQQALRQTNIELVRSNQELDERRRNMEIVLRNVAAGVISVDSHGVITTINKSAEELLQVAARDVVGKNFREVLKHEQIDTLKGILRDMVMAKQDTISRQVTVPIRDSRATLLFNLTMLRDESGEFLGTVVVFDDLTQLIKAQRMAAWREVARRIAHEIKNPLTPIQLSAQRLRKRYLPRFGDEDTVFDECTAMIVKSVDELKNLVNEFSSFARMPAANPAPNDLNGIIREALTLFSQGHRAISFGFREDRRLPHLQLDRDQIKRVFINLLDNAVAAVAEEGEIEIESRFDPVLKMAVITVADTGHGIAPEDKPRLFEPYFSTKKSGTGLGLAIVSTIIADHNGFIRVRDNLPHGTKFIIELPVTA